MNDTAHRPDRDTADVRVSDSLPRLQAVEIRMDCVRLLLGTGAYNNPRNCVEAARILADFVLGTRDAEVIGAARQFAETLKA